MVELRQNGRVFKDPSWDEDEQKYLDSRPKPIISLKIGPEMGITIHEHDFYWAKIPPGDYSIQFKLNPNAQDEYFLVLRRDK
jgi:hypothetical protein